MEEITKEPSLQLQIAVTGQHLSAEFGSTWKIIEKDGFHINAKIEMLLSSDTHTGIAKSVGLGTIGFADSFTRLKPDIVVLLGDRFEILAAAQAAMFMQIPMAHIHGGEATEGMIDEAVRHAITKMAHLHFTAAPEYKQRVVQMGEDPRRVYDFGAPGLDQLAKLRLLPRNELENALNFKLAQINFLVTYHPVTLVLNTPQQAVQELLGALDRFPAAHVIFTRQNSDAGGHLIGKMFENYAVSQPQRCKIFDNLGQLLYLSCMSQCDLVIGNSSSGLTEAPALHKPTVNLGDRQSGRLRAKSVLDCVEKASDISTCIEKALSSRFRQRIANGTSPYGSGGASKKIAAVLAEVDLTGILFKRFQNMR